MSNEAGKCQGRKVSWPDFVMAQNVVGKKCLAGKYFGRGMSGRLVSGRRVSDRELLAYICLVTDKKPWKKYFANHFMYLVISQLQAKSMDNPTTNNLIKK